MVIDVYSIQGVRGASIPVEVVADLKPIDLGRSVVECTAPVVFKGAATNAGDCMVVDGRITSKAKATYDMAMVQVRDMKYVKETMEAIRAMGFGANSNIEFVANFMTVQRCFQARNQGTVTMQVVQRCTHRRLINQHTVFCTYLIGQADHQVFCYFHDIS